MADKTDDLVISISTDLTTIRRQLRELGQVITQQTAGYSKGFESFGKRMDAAVNTTGVQKRINQLTGIATKSTKEWTGALANQGAALDALRAKYSPLFAAQQTYLANLKDIRTAQAIGALSANEAAAAIAGQKAAFATSVVAIRGTKTAIDASTKSFKLNRVGMMELQAAGVNAFQALASGMSVARVAQMEGAQVIGAFAQGTEGGLKALVGSAVGLATKFPLATAAIAAAGVAFGAYELLGRKEVESLDDVLKKHKEVIESIRGAYGDAALAAHDYGKDASQELGVRLAASVDELKVRLKAGLSEAFKDSGGLGQGTYSINAPFAVSPEFAQFKDQIVRLYKEGAPALQGIRSEIVKIGEENGAEVAATKLLDLLKNFFDMEEQIREGSKGIDEATRKFSDLQHAIDQIRASGDAKDKLQEIFDGAKNGNKSIEDVTSALQTLENTNLTLAGPIAALQDLFSKAVAARNALNPQSQLPTLGTVGPVYSGGGKFIDANQVQTDRANATKSQYQLEQEKLAKSARRTPIPRRTADDRFSEDIAAITARTTALAQERGLLGATYEEQMRVNTAYDLTQKALKEVREEARRKGDADWQNAKLTPEQIALINQKSEAYAQQAEALKKARDAMQETADASREFAQTFIDDMLTGKSAVEALGDALKQLSKRFEELGMNQLFGGGSVSGGGFLGGIFTLDLRSAQ